ncbi:MAG: nucleotidyltransferase domain-containing protein [Candidatus Competibacteraceae bacterium]|nr:nucleotidyltransferase domain-containing protein [Candidatus Competibacteraceae bacterium]
MQVQISDKVRQQIMEAVAHRLADRHYRLYLYGSRVQGRATPRSDFDLGLLAEEPLNMALLEQLREDLEALPILQKMELTDLNRASPDFVKRALKTSEVLDEH